MKILDGVYVNPLINTVYNAHNFFNRFYGIFNIWEVSQ
jgi:hypothetical protein